MENTQSVKPVVVSISDPFVLQNVASCRNQLEATFSESVSLSEVIGAIITHVAALYEAETAVAGKQVSPTPSLLYRADKRLKGADLFFAQRDAYCRHIKSVNRANLLRARAKYELLEAETASKEIN